MREVYLKEIKEEYLISGLFPPHCGLSIIFKTAPNTKLASDKPLDLQQQTAGGSTSICRRSCFFFFFFNTSSSCQTFVFQRFLCCFFWTSADFSCFQHFFFFFFIFFSRTAHMAVCVSPLIFTCTSLASRSRSYFKGKVFLSAGLTFQMNVRNPQLDSILFTFFSQNECEVLVS